MSLSTLQTRRGAGLGNEIFGWAKAYIGSVTFGHRLIDPPWYLNQRPYRSELEATLGGTVEWGAAMLLPKQSVTQSALSGIWRGDYREALETLHANGLLSSNHNHLHTSGMFGGYQGIKPARPFLRSRMFSTRGAVKAQLRLENLPSDALRIGIHVRRGDFDATPPGPGQFNKSLPQRWYLQTLSSLRQSLDVPVEVVIASDSSDHSLDDAIDQMGIRTHRLADSSVGDLAVLAASDFIVPSVSSFSMLALFLSDAPYAWYSAQLSSNSGWQGIWATEVDGAGAEMSRRSIRAMESDTTRACFTRSVAIEEKHRWQPSLLDFLNSKVEARRESSDLIYYGVLRGDD